MKLFTKFTGLILNNKFKILALLLIVICAACFYCKKPAPVWATGLRSLFVNNQAIIYSINLRTFGAKDYNENDIIDIDLGEVKGTFINAIPKLKTLKEHGINTVYLMPITKIGKLHAMGTAGSLYAMDSFSELNPQLLDETEIDQDITHQAKTFMNAAHELGMYVIVDLPGCGSYEMSLLKPELFRLNGKGRKIVPSDWTDVRLFEVYNEDGKSINRALIDEHKKFMDLMLSINADGVRVDAAATKPIAFWKEIINYTRQKNPEFMFLAEASPEWKSPVHGDKRYMTVEQLLGVGFDGFYQDWSDLSLIKTNKMFYQKIETDLRILKKFGNSKSVIGTFATHDQISPMLLGYNYWQMVLWLNNLLPLNPYTLDGFPSADKYDYKVFDGKADITYTDNYYYCMKKGVIDLYNFSRAPKFFSNSVYDSEYDSALKLRNKLNPLITSKNFVVLKTSDDMVFAFKKQVEDELLIVYGNLDQKRAHKAEVKIPDFKENDTVIPFKIKNAPIAKDGKFSVELEPLEIQILVIKKQPQETKN